MIGLDKYMYNEGFAYRLLPLKPDTAVGPLEASNTGKMYENMMTKYKWGNMKNASYLDHESMTMFYPLITRLYSTLADDLAKAGKPDSARKVLKKYDEVMPTTINSLEIAVRKYYMIENAYRLNDIQLGNKLANLVDDYVSNQLDYSYALIQKGETNLENRDLQYSMQILGGLVEFSKQYKQPQLFNKFSAQLSGFEKKFGVTGKK